MKNIFFEIHECALDSVDVTFRKVQNSTLLILKVGKLGRIEYVDRDIFTGLTYLGFHLEHKVSKCMQMFSKVYCILVRALCLLADHVS